MDVTSVMGVSPIVVDNADATHPKVYLAADPAMTPVLPPAISAEYLTGAMTSPGGVLDAVSSHIGWFNVKDDFGARGDGATDDTAAIQAAIAACT